jgi:hypothetical protein
LKISEKAYFKDAVTALMVPEHESYKPEKAVLILGHDQQNSDNRAGGTLKREHLRTMTAAIRKYSKSSCELLDLGDRRLPDASTERLKFFRFQAITITSGNVAPWRILKAWYRNVPKGHSPQLPEPSKVLGARREHASIHPRQ